MDTVGGCNSCFCVCGVHVLGCSCGLSHLKSDIRQPAATMGCCLTSSEPRLGIRDECWS